LQTFGCCWNTYPVVINGEATVTTSLTVNLYIYGAGWAEQMQLSNNGVTWTEWRPCSIHESSAKSRNFTNPMPGVEAAGGPGIAMAAPESP
jgi:hypothetical protein